MTRLLFLCSVLLLSFLSQVAVADTYAVIVHPDNNANFDPDVVARIFLSKEKTFSNGEQAVPLHINRDSEIRSLFMSAFIGKSDSQVRSYWTMLLFSGKGHPPKEVESSADMIDLIANNVNLIGYVRADEVTDKVKVVANF